MPLWMTPEIRESLSPVERALAVRLGREIERSLDPRELRRRGPRGLEEIVVQALALLRGRRSEEIRARVEQPGGLRAGRTTIEVSCTDGPFLVDTLRLTLRRLGLRERILLHPVLSIERGPDGVLDRVHKELGEAPTESYLYVEVPLIRDPERRRALETELREIYGEVHQVVRHHGRMVKALRRHIADLECATPVLADGPEGVHALMRFLDWLAEDNYIFLGYRYYSVARSEADWSVTVSPESGLGILHDASGSRFADGLTGTDLPEVLRRRLDDARLVFFDKSRHTSRIHRPGNLDCISVKGIDNDGHVVGFGQFVGLLTYRALRTRPSEIPILRETRNLVLERAGGRLGSHTSKIAAEAYDSLPVEMLFQFPQSDVVAAVERIVAVTDHERLGFFLLPEPTSRSFFVSVIVPRSRYDENLRNDLHRLLRTDYGVVYADSRVTFLDDEVALIHFFCTTPEDGDLDALRGIERDVESRVTRWEEGLEGALLESCREERAYTLVDDYAEAFPRSYRVRTPGREAVADVQALERIRSGEASLLVDLRPDPDEDLVRLSVYQASRPYLTDLLPKLDHFGLRVLDATLAPVSPSGGAPLWIVTFRVEGLQGRERGRERWLVEALLGVMRGTVGDDPLNRLVLASGLHWREADLLRGYLAYAHQIGASPGKLFATDALAAHPEATRALVRLFRARFDPDLEARAEEERASTLALAEARRGIQTSAEDRVFALLSNLVQATVRTSYFQDIPDDEPILALKLDPSRVDRIPEPRPFAEIFVHSASMWGVHLRGAPVARGGVRWSSRSGDFRTEILGLMKTQRIKNGLIVPGGAKGGFVLRHRIADPEEANEEAARQYARYVRALLSLTDNRIGDRVVPPDRVVRHDGDDPYLVVAPDKGTAGLSDVANRIAAETDFWLGDAFASGGSEGYDHKREGITARGAWSCVRRHFAEIGLDPERDPFTMVGIGDMSGDVFGNGALLARNAKLLAAFNHRHVFLDPDPDPDRAYRERHRLFQLPASTWRDYDASAISEGGGVFARDAREVPLSPRVRELLELPDQTVSGEEVVRAILRMPVDLLWNGGIGTYVKGSGESHTEVGDRSNDAVRIDAGALRARVVGEGGNLGLTLRARVEAARRGCRINTDAVDNSGGVDLSDHEVNFKILLAPALHAGRLSREDRNRILNDSLGRAVDHVLANTASQALCLSLDERRSQDDPDAFVRATEFLARHVALDPEVEGLPDPEEIRARTGEGNRAAYTRPELAVLLGYTKMFAKRAVLASDVPDREIFRTLSDVYLPEPLRRRFPEEVRRHPLRREMATTVLVNRVVDHAGVGMLPRLVEGLGVTTADAVAAYDLAARILGAERLRSALRADSISEEARLTTLRRVEQAVRRVARILLAVERALPVTEAEVEAAVERCAQLQVLLDGRPPWGRTGAEDLVELLQQDGASPSLVADISRIPRVVRSLPVLPLVDDGGRSLPEVLDSWERIGHLTRMGDLLLRLEAETRRGGWERLAAEGLYVDAFEVLRALTRVALSDSEAGIDRFLTTHRDALERVAATVERADAADRASLAPLTLLVQQLRRLC